MCGADRGIDLTTKAGSGSPPRVRSRQQASFVDRAMGGITSACAEQTLSLCL